MTAGTHDAVREPILLRLGVSKLVRKIMGGGPAGVASIPCRPVEGWRHG